MKTAAEAIDGRGSFLTGGHPEIDEIWDIGGKTAIDYGSNIPDTES